MPGELQGKQELCSANSGPIQTVIPVPLAPFTTAATCDTLHKASFLYFWFLDRVSYLAQAGLNPPVLRF